MNIDNEIMLHTYDLIDMINSSDEIKEYIKYKQALEKDDKVNSLKKRLAKEKLQFEEAERFGHFHPNYHQEKEKIDKSLVELDKIELVKEYKNAEEKLDELLYLVSNTLAQSISTSIKVPKNDTLDEGSACSTQGCSSCSSKKSCSI